MSLDISRFGREGAPRVIDALSDWAPRHGPVLGLHPGDIGWHLRLDDADLADTLVLVRDGSEPVAAALVEGDLIRAAINPSRWDDQQVAESLGELTFSLPTAGDAYSDAPAHAAYRTWLSAQGWSIDPDPWVVLYRPLSADDGEYQDPACTTLDNDADIADRVAVQFAAFEHSTFTVDRWRQMAAGPSYDASLDLLRRDSDGTPVAGATGWMAGKGGCGILEPVGTHRDHVGAGHGKAVSLAAIAALARAGASGVAIQTPSSNVGAVRTYESCGLRVVEHLHAMMRASESNSG